MTGDTQTQQRKAASDYFYGLDELSGSQRQVRLHDLATMLHEVVIANGGRVSRQIALSTLADRLGTTTRQVRFGIVPGESLGLFARSDDGLDLVYQA